jgi:hypothetical protein
MLASGRYEAALAKYFQQLYKMQWMRKTNAGCPAEVEGATERNIAVRYGSPVT